MWIQPLFTIIPFNSLLITQIGKLGLIFDTRPCEIDDLAVSSRHLFVGYSIRTSNYPERIVLSNPSHMMSMAHPIAISVETLGIDSRCSLEKEFTELICMNP